MNGVMVYALVITRGKDIANIIWEVGRELISTEVGGLLNEMVTRDAPALRDTG